MLLPGWCLRLPSSVLVTRITYSVAGVCGASCASQMSSPSSVLRLLLSLLLLLLPLLIEARYVPIPRICSQPPPRSDGICTIEIEGFYYDPVTLDCQMYTIGACRLTPGQSFGSQQDCVNKCVRGLQSQRRSPDYYRNE